MGGRKMSEPQPKATALSTYLVPAIALLVIVIAAYLGYQLGLNAQLKLTGKQKRQQAYSEFMGRKVVLTQLITSHLVADTYFEYHERKRGLAGGPTEASLHLEEARRWQHRGEDLALEIAKSSQSLFETLGFIRSYFAYSARLKELTNQLYHAKGFEVKRQVLDWNAEQLEEWKVKTIKEVREIVDGYEKLFDELVTYLEAEIDKEAG
jgi:hypothetical protein